MNLTKRTCILLLIGIVLSTAGSNNVLGKETLKFDTTRYTIKNATVNNLNITFRAYEKITYVAQPVDATFQSMNIYIPEDYFKGKSIGQYSKQNAPIFMPNQVGGYMPGRAGEPGMKRDGSTPNSILQALAHGYIVASPAIRGRTTMDEKGKYTGKAPACIVDYKAAVRYLRFNDEIMPGSAERIIANGTSAGGALSALLGATGNSPDYEAMLDKLEAAKVNDNIFAASCYCPITNLDHADAAYEWQFSNIYAISQMKSQQMADWNRMREEVKDQLTENEINTSEELKLLFPRYVNNLKLKDPNGKLLTLDEKGNGSFKDYLTTLLVISAQNALDKGTDLSGIKWLDIKDGKIKNLDFSGYIAFATRMKRPPAFDGLALKSPENDLFGTSIIAAQHFTAYSTKHTTTQGTMAESRIVKMMNPMEYIDTKGVITAPHWRIRHGSIDRDTSLGIPLILAIKLQNTGHDVDFSIPWGIPHSGDYDLNELFRWIDEICK